MNSKKDFSAITPKLKEYANLCENDTQISKDLYLEHKVFRGLRDLNGKGVLTGLTEVSEIISKKTVNGEEVPTEGKLFYRGYRIEDIVNGFLKGNRFGFEEVIYLLLFRNLPTNAQLEDFKQLLSEYRSLPDSFVRDIIMKAPSTDVMNSLARSVLTLYSYDKNPDDTSVANVLRQCIQLIATFPQLAVYSYRSYSYYIKGNDTFFIREPKPELSTAENILHMLRIDGKYTELEAKVLDLALVLHAEHGGGNNSTFTTHVVSSSGTDTYSAIAAALGSLKGPRHGGANAKVTAMFRDIKANVKDWSDKEEIKNYLQKILDKKAFDNSGLIYGIGHAIYSVSDPRSKIFRGFVEMLSEEKGLQAEFSLYEAIEELAPELISKQRKMYKGVSANIDFYSGFVYEMLGLPKSLYTPIFATARIVGWSAHRIEEIVNSGKIIRPAYMNVQDRREYVDIENR